MAEDHDKNESESESEYILKLIEMLQMRIRALEGEVEAMQRGDSTGYKHENDGGYFD